MASVLEVVIRAQDQFSATLRQVEGSLQSLESRIEPLAAHSRKVLLGVTALAAGFTGAATAGVALAAQMEQTRIAFTTMLGSAQKADRFLRDLWDFAARTPFEFQGLVNASRQLMAMGFAAEDVIPVMTAVGNAVSALGGGQFEIERVVRALGQMGAKGKVTAEEMRQLAELGLPVWRWLAEAIGVSIPEAMKKAEKSGISAATGIRAIIEGINREFPGMMERQSRTILGMWSTIKDNITAVLRTLGEEIIRTFNIGGIMERVIQWLQVLANVIQQRGLRGALEAIFPPHVRLAIIAIAGAIAGMLVPALIQATLAAVRFFAAMGPWAAIGSAVALAVAIIIRNFGNLARAVRAIGEMFAGLGGIIIGALTLDISRIRSNWNRITDAFGDLRESIAGIGQRIVSDARAVWDAFSGGWKFPELQQTVEASLENMKVSLKGFADVAKGETDEVSKKVKKLQDDFVDLAGVVTPKMRQMAEAWQGFASEAVRAMGWMGQSTEATFKAAISVIEESTNRAIEAIHRLTQELVRDFITVHVPALVEAGRAWQGFASEAVRAMGWMGRTHESVARSIDEAIDREINALHEFTQQLVRDFLQTHVPALVQAGKAWEGFASEATRAMGWLGRSTERTLRAAESVAKQTANTLSAAWRQWVQNANAAQMNWYNVVSSTMTSIQSAFAQFFLAVLSGQKSLGEALVDLWNALKIAILRVIAEMLAQWVAKQLAAAIAGIWASLFKTYGILWWMFVGLAVAAIAAATGLIKLAEGGIVKKPTIALVGEEGPEAVIPLNRFALATAGPSRQITLNVTFSGPLLGNEMDALKFARRIMAVMRREERRA